MAIIPILACPACIRIFRSTRSAMAPPNNPKMSIGIVQLALTNASITPERVNSYVRNVRVSICMCDARLITWSPTHRRRNLPSDREVNVLCSPKVRNESLEIGRVMVVTENPDRAYCSKDQMTLKAQYRIGGDSIQSLNRIEHLREMVSYKGLPAPESG